MSMDFCFLCQKDQGKSMPTLVMRSKPPGYTGAFVCPGKSTRNEAYSDKIVERATAFVDNLGYKRIGVKSDQEESMKALQSRVQTRSKAEIVLLNSKKYDSQSNGVAEQAVQDVEGQARTLKLHLENRIMKTLPPGHPVVHWLVE